jgi:subtilase family serine protease
MVQMKKKLPTRKFRTWLRIFALGSLAALACSAALPASAASGHYIANNTPNFVATATNLGPANASETIDVSIWLRLANRGTLDKLVGQLYDRTSPDYRNWLKPSDITNLAPSAGDVQTVEKFLTSQNLSIVTVGPFNMFVRARGTVAQVERAFQVKINNYDVNGTTYRANASNPYVEGAAASLTSVIYGLDNLAYQHPFITRYVANQSASKADRATSGDALAFTSHCFTGTKTEHYTTDGSLPIATYTGNGYTDDIAGCGYTPPEIQTAYNLTGLYGEGFDGTGQTIAIIDWCGSPTIQNDANAFSAQFGLPALTSSNFKILYSSTLPTCASPDPEINIDVEWAHAIAPGANLDLVVPPSASFMDVDDAELYVLAHSLGNVISGSYGSEELYTPGAVLNEENLINEIAAGMGVSADFATGDSGDYTFDIGPPSFPASVSAPADSPYATGVGGISLALNSANTIDWQAGWGTNLNQLISSGAISDPPTNGFFYAGAGGGSSAVFAKPSFQKKLTGTQRLLPDISWLADPYTGGVIAITEGFVSPTLEWTVYGGTSLATPMFSGLWAIANEEAGVALGQAARYVYSMPASTILDVVPVGSPTNVTATIQDSTGTTTYTAAQLAAPLEGTTTFYSVLWDYPLTQDTTLDLMFGTDSGLKTAPGWDDVTGMGVPNGKVFADFFNPK